MKTWKSTCFLIGLLTSAFLFSTRVAADSSPVKVSPGSLNFGSQNVGITSGAGAASLTNHNSAVVAFTVAITGDFSETNECGGVVAPGASCTLKVYFTPTLVGAETGSLGIYGDFPGSPLIVGLSGTGALDGFKAIVVTPASPTVPLGLTQQFTATGYYSNGTAISLPNAMWSSSAPAVATVSNISGSQGLATTVSQGAASISAAFGSFVGSATLTVAPPQLVSSNLSPSNPSVPLGRTQQFSAVGTYTDGSTRDLTATAVWSSSNPAVATVSAGVATSVGMGTTTILASSGAVSASTTLTVTPPVLASIALSPSAVRIVLGVGQQTQQFTATGTYTDGSVRDLTDTATWTSSNTSVATVVQGLATPTARAIGAPSITAGLGSVSGSATLTVVGVQSISVSPASFVLPIGETQRLTATAQLSDGTTLDVTNAAAWASSNAAVATVTQTGLVTGVSQVATGSSNTSITATIGYTDRPPHAVTGVASIVVLPPALLSVTLSPAGSTLRSGTSEQLTATGAFSDGSQQDLTGVASWSSSNPGVVTAGPTGLVGGVGPGVATITATVFNTPLAPPSGVSGSTGITDTGTLVSLTLSPATASVALGLTEQFSAVGNYSDGSASAVTTGTWSSSNPSAATVVGGLATTVGQGSTTITAAVGSATGSATLTVIPPALVSISVTPAHPSILVDGTEQMTATGTYTDKSSRDLTGTATWSSTDSSAASVAAGGLVTGAAVGSATITATSDSVTGSTPLAVYASGQARFAYVADLNGDSIGLFLVDNATGSLVPAGATVTPNDAPGAAAADPTGHFLYVTSEFNLYGYAIDQLTGSLEPLPGTPVFVNTADALAVHPSGKSLLVAESCCGVVAYALDSNGVPTFSSAASANSPVSVAFDPAGAFAYASNVNGDSVSIFSVNASTGQLTEISGSPFSVLEPNPSSVAVYPLGGYLLLTNENDGSISVYALDPTSGGLLGSAVNYPVGECPQFAAIDGGERFAYVMNDCSNDVSAFTLDSSTGSLTPMTGSPFSTGLMQANNGPNMGVVDPTGSYLYTANFGEGAVVVFSIDPTTGALTKVSQDTSLATPFFITLVR